MKNDLLPCLFIGVLLLGIAISCTTQNTAPKIQPAYLKVLLGRWEIVEATVYSKKNGETERVLGAFRNGLAYIFYDNNSYDGCIQSGSDWDNTGQSATIGTWKCSTDKTGRWTLTVGKISSQSGYLDDDSSITLNAPTLKDPQVYKFYYMDDKDLVLGSAPTKDISGTETWMKLVLVKK